MNEKNILSLISTNFPPTLHRIWRHRGCETDSRLLEAKWIKLNFRIESHKRVATIASSAKNLSICCKYIYSESALLCNFVGTMHAHWFALTGTNLYYHLNGCLDSLFLGNFIFACFHHKSISFLCLLNLENQQLNFIKTFVITFGFWKNCYSAHNAP